MQLALRRGMSNKSFVFGLLAIAGLAGVSSFAHAEEPQEVGTQSYTSEELTSFSKRRLQYEGNRQAIWLIATCKVDLAKVAVSGFFESLPIVSIFDNLFGGSVHTTLRDYDQDSWADHNTDENTMSNAILGGPLNSGYHAIRRGLLIDRDHPPTGSYYTTRLLIHDSFDPKYGSQCTTAAQALADIQRELRQRGFDANFVDSPFIYTSKDRKIADTDLPSTSQQVRTVSDSPR